MSWGFGGKKNSTMISAKPQTIVSKVQLSTIQAFISTPQHSGVAKTQAIKYMKMDFRVEIVLKNTKISKFLRKTSKFL